MEAIEGLWERFSLSEQEGNMVDLADAPSHPKSFLAAKFLTRRTLNIEAVARTFMPLWKTEHGFSIRDMNDNKLIFVFEEEVDRERVMLGEPWAYDKYLVILQWIEEEEAIEEVDFGATSFWVQLHGLPVRRINPEVASILGSSLGKVDPISAGEAHAEGGHAMRIRVSIDITNPLCRGRLTRSEKGCEAWISFKYERLSNFCYWCGQVTHSDKDCAYWLCNKDKLKVEDQQYGPWLRASTERPWRKTEIKVAGFCHPTKPKYPNPPASPRNPHPSPPHKTNLPTIPKTTTPHPTPPNPHPVTHTSSSIVHTVAPRPPQTTTMLRPETIPPVDFVVHMEVEENPRIDFPPWKSQKERKIFLKVN